MYNLLQNICGWQSTNTLNNDQTTEQLHKQPDFAKKKLII